MLLKLVILVSFTVLCLGCSHATKVVIKNFDDSEYYEEVKEDALIPGQKIKYHCMSSYYLEKILEAKIKKVNPK